MAAAQINTEGKVTTLSPQNFLQILKVFLSTFGNSLSEALPQQLMAVVKQTIANPQATSDLPTSPFSFFNFAQQHVVEMLDVSICAGTVKTILVTMISSYVDKTLLTLDLSDAKLVRNALEQFITSVDELAPAELG